MPKRIYGSDFKVVVSQDGKYSIVPIDEPDTRAWRGTGLIGTKEQCLTHIEEVWTDMRPTDLSRLRSSIGMPESAG